MYSFIYTLILKEVYIMEKQLSFVYKLESKFGRYLSPNEEINLCELHDREHEWKCLYGVCGCIIREHG